MKQREPNSPGLVRQFALPGDAPMAGVREAFAPNPQTFVPLSVWRPKNGTWYLCPILVSGADLLCQFGLVATIQFGLPGDVPMNGDVDGDGALDLLVYRPANGVWYEYFQDTCAASSRQWGLKGDLPVNLGTRDLMNYLFKKKR